MPAAEICTDEQHDNDNENDEETQQGTKFDRAFIE